MLLWVSLVFLVVAHGSTKCGYNNIQGPSPQRPAASPSLCFMTPRCNLKGYSKWPWSVAFVKPIKPSMIFTIKPNGDQNKNGNKETNIGSRNENSKDNNNGVTTSKTKKFFLGTQTAVSWIDAVQRCSANNRQLASIKNQKEQDLLEETIKSQGHENNQFWIGGSDLAKEGHFVWMGCQPMTYTNWYRKQPDNHKMKEHCVVFSGVCQEFKWNDIECGTLLYYVCEYY